MTTFTLPRFDQDEATADSGFGALHSAAGNLPLKQLAYRTRIVGLVCRTTITQTFYNPFDECIEATYIFPIEGEQAVIGCAMWVADRLVRAKLKERGKARADYRRAISRGHRAALLEENRPETLPLDNPCADACDIQLETTEVLDDIGLCKHRNGCENPQPDDSSACLARIDPVSFAIDTAFSLKKNDRH